ncbi:MAG TPA: HEAT repeat domain-containing protein [Polyangiaceae bacterium]|jgi:HEAT repeat protein|nr:HEAT repeat domain-containing protein [Polyangiaceae bacterium]
MTELAQSYSGTGAPLRWRQSVATILEPRRQHDKSRAVEDQVRGLVAAAGDISWSGDKTRSVAARETLVLGGSLSVPIVLQAVAALPRPDVQDEAITILRCIAEQGAASQLLKFASAPDLAPPARATLARALGVAILTPQLVKDALQTLTSMLSDPSAEVRDAAVAALSDRGGSEAKQALQRALQTEKADFVRAAIREAISEC